MISHNALIKNGSDGDYFNIILSDPKDRKYENKNELIRLKRAIDIKLISN
jgi:hypothetical protein